MKRDEIIKILHKIEENEDIKIIYACESGSRVWGFSNEKSDYDVRFIYKKRNVGDYLTLKRECDVVECMGDELDIVGWDIKKALKLHHKSNPSLREWLISDEVYIDCGIESVFDGLGEFDVDVLKNHYASIAINHWKKYSSLGFENGKAKKYLYVIRSILCWRLLNLEIYPPLNIYQLLNHESLNLDDRIRKAVLDLIDYHQSKGELSEDTILKLNNFIMDSLSVMDKVKTKPVNNIDDYDERFRELLLVVS